MKVIQTIADVIKEMKKKPRRGWVDHQIPRPETVWEHTVMMRQVCRELSSRYLGPQHANHCARLAAVHDMTEGIVPDITRYMGISIL